jgi:5-methylcytosine-specific restriction endonuclease McrA
VTPARLPAATARLIRDRARSACEYCLLPQEWQEAEFHFDHIVPRKAGGQSDADNLALACVGCSLHKGAQSAARDPVTLQVVALFNPRQDEFEEHFRWTRTWRLVGRTAIGRATIVALDINRPRLLAIRRDLAARRKFPPR